MFFTIHMNSVQILVFNFLTRNKCKSQKYPDPNHEYRTGFSQLRRPLQVANVRVIFSEAPVFLQVLLMVLGNGFAGRISRLWKKVNSPFHATLAPHPSSISQNHSVTVHRDAVCKFHEIKLTKPSSIIKSVEPDDGKLKHECYCQYLI